MILLFMCSYSKLANCHFYFHYVELLLAYCCYAHFKFMLLLNSMAILFCLVYTFILSFLLPLAHDIVVSLLIKWCSQGFCFSLFFLLHLLLHVIILAIGFSSFSFVITSTFHCHLVFFHCFFPWYIFVCFVL